MVDVARSAGRSMGDPRVVLPSRREIRAELESVLRDSGVVWAWQGPDGAVQRWEDATGPADLDIWWRPGSGAPALDIAGLVARLESALPAARVADGRDPARLRHTSLVVRGAAGLSVIDLTHGDLRVGPVLLLPAEQVAVSPGPEPRLLGAAGAADLLLRPLLRGRVPEPDRVAQARQRWAEAAPAQRRDAVAVWRRSLGPRAADRVAGALVGGPVDASLGKALRRRLMTRTLHPRALRSTWRQRATIVPAGRRATPLGLRGRGVTVAFVGTDGSGKSTVSAQLAERLAQSGFTTSSAYFGMARGNLPGVALARRLLGVGGVEPPTPGSETGPTAGAEPAPAAAQPSLDRHLLRRAAAWFYAAEYVWRYQRLVAPARRRGEVVLIDRYVYDLRESPWPGSAASRLAEALVPAPDVLALPDAPDEMIHARKPERPAAEQAAQQDRYRRLVAESPARRACVVVDTSGQAADTVAGLELAVISAAHHVPGESSRDAGPAANQQAGRR